MKKQDKIDVAWRKKGFTYLPPGRKKNASKRWSKRTLDGPFWQYSALIIGKKRDGSERRTWRWLTPRKR